MAVVRLHLQMAVMAEHLSVHLHCRPLLMARMRKEAEVPRSLRQALEEMLRAEIVIPTTDPQAL